MGWCNCLSGVKYFFRYDWHDGTFRTTDTDLPDADLAWARDTMVAYAKSVGAVRDREVVAFGSPERSFGRFKNWRSSHQRLVRHAVRRAEQEAVVAVFVVARDVVKGLPVVAYGYVTDPKPFLAPVFANIRGGPGEPSSLLPPALIGPLPIDSILSISVATPTGAEVYRSPGWAPPWYSAPTRSSLALAGS